MSQISNIITFFPSELLPQEERLQRVKRNKEVSIGIPKEQQKYENRIPLIPQSVGLLIANGFNVVVEEDAGIESGFSNEDFIAAGAKIAYHRPEVFECDIICKVAPLTIDEIRMSGKRKTIITALNLTRQTPEYFHELQIGKHTCLSYEYIQDKSGIHPLVRSISEITGTSLIYIIAELMANTEHGKARLLGGLPGIAPTELVVLGAGTVAEYAIRAALNLGVSVKVFDNSLYKLRRLKTHIGKEIYTSTIQPRLLETALLQADVAIGAMYSQKALSPLLVTRDMVCKMKEGAIIVDVSIDQGGCFETSRPTDHQNPTFKECGVLHYCVPNIASRYPYTASQVLSNSLTDILLNIGEAGGIDMIIRFDPGLRKGVYVYQGIITKSPVGKYFKLPYQDIKLLLSSVKS